MTRRWTLAALLALAVHARTVDAQETSEVPAMIPSPAGTIELAADLLEVDLDGSAISATGHVLVSMPPVQLSCAGLSVDGSSMQIDEGTITLALPRGLVGASAQSIRFGEGHVELGHGVLSLCSCVPPPWSLAFSELTVDPEGDVTLKRGALRIGGVSVLPLPWLLLRTGREPALLPPGIGWIAGRGLHLQLGLYLPMPLGLDLHTHIGWIAPTGLSLAATLSTPGKSITASMVFDPVNEGIDAGWLHGRFWGASRGQHLGLLLDLPLSSEFLRADMPGLDAGAQRQAISRFVAHLAPSVGHVSLMPSVSMVRSLQPSDASMLHIGQTWITAPAAMLALSPVNITGGRFSLTAAAQLGYMMLMDVSGEEADAPRLDSTGVGVVLASHLLPGRVVDLDVTLSWHGALIRGAGLEETTLTSQKLGGQVAASMALAGPVSKKGFGHRIDLGLQYRATLDNRWGTVPLAAPKWLPDVAPLHLASVTIENSIEHNRKDVLVLDLTGWILSRRAEPEGMLSVSGLLDLGGAIVELSVDLSGRRMTPSQLSTRLTAFAAGVMLTARHLYLTAHRPTSLDIELWSSGSLMIGPVPGRDETLHLAMVGLAVPLGLGVTFGVEGAMDLRAQSVSHVLATLDYAHPCQCLRIGVSVLARVGVGAPDVLLTLSL